MRWQLTAEVTVLGITNYQCSDDPKIELTAGFPLFWTDKIPWLFQYFLPFSSIFLMFYYF